jgi:hypothetical protein
MKRRIHHLIRLSCLLIVLLLLSGPAYSQSLTRITESDIQAMIAGMDKAARKGNVAGMIAYFAPDIKITMRVLNPGSDKEQVGTLTKDQYAFNARNNMRRKLAYYIERKNTRIKIYDEQTATVTGDLYETLKFRGGTLRMASSGVAYISLRDGKLVITAMEARMRVY